MDFESAKRIYQYFSPIRTEYARNLSQTIGLDIFCKYESRNFTGSFKERGVLNALLALRPKKGVITASAGNHGLALSYYASILKIPCIVVVPVNAPATKVNRIRSFGAKVILRGQIFDEAKEEMYKIQRQKGYQLIHPFDQVEVIEGQSTIGLEIISEVPEVRSILVPIGGGGLISGISAAVKRLNPKIRIYGVRSEWTRHKHMTNVNSLADGIAVKSLGKITSPIVKRNVDRIFYVSEEQIADAILMALNQEKVLVEGAGAAGLIPLMEGWLTPEDFPTCVVICGSNIDISTLSRVILRKLRQDGRLVKIRVAIPDKPGMLGLCATKIGELGGQIIQTYHDRLDAPTPNLVGVTFLVEVLDREHVNKIQKALKKLFQLVDVL